MPAFSEFNRLKKEILVCVCVCVYLLLTERIELRQFSAFCFPTKQHLCLVIPDILAYTRMPVTSKRGDLFPIIVLGRIFPHSILLLYSK